MPVDPTPAVQDYYPEDVAHCYGCGRLNPDGLQLKTRWDGDHTIARFTPKACHTAMPGFVYGGLLASLIDCHAMGTAAAASERAAGRVLGDGPAPRFVTASLNITYLRPTSIDGELVLRGEVTQLAERKVVVHVTITAGGEVTVRGDVVAVRLPSAMSRRAD